MKLASFSFALLSLSAMSAAAAGTWTTTAVNDVPPVLVTAAGGNLARFARTQTTATANGSCDVRWLVNGMHEEKDGGGIIYQMKTGARAEFAFPAEARLDEVRFHTFWDSGRNDFGFESVDVRDANGDWTTLDNSSLALSSTSRKGNTYAFADAGGDPLATGVTAVRIVLGNVENGWGGVSEIEVLGAFPGTRTVTFCDTVGVPLPGVAAQTVPTGGAATEPDPSLVPQRNGSLVFAGWDADIHEVFTNTSPRPVYDRFGVLYSRNAVWTKTPLAQATAAATRAFSPCAPATPPARGRPSTGLCCPTKFRETASSGTNFRSPTPPASRSPAASPRSKSNSARRRTATSVCRKSKSSASSTCRPPPR